MLKITKDQKFIYSGKDLVLHVQHLVCSDCEAVYVRSRIENTSTNQASREMGTIGWDSNVTCQICDNHKYDLTDYSADKIEIERIVENTRLDKPGTTLRAIQPRGNRQTDLWNIIYGIGKVEQNRFGVVQCIPDRYAIQCTKCGHMKLIDDEGIKDLTTTVCNKCKQKLVIDITNASERHLKSLSQAMEQSKEYEKHLENQKKQDEEAKKQAEKKKDISKMRARFHEYNPNMHMVTGYKVGAMDVTYAYCDNCGTPTEIYDANLVSLRKNFKCEGCLIQQENRNYLGLYKRDLTTTTKNGLVCIKDNGDTVDLECKCCSKKYNDISKVKFLLGKITCNRKDNCGKIDVICNNENCYYCNSFRILDIERARATGILNCKSCGTNLFLQARIDVRLNDHNIEVRQTLNDLAERVKGEVTLENSLARESKVLYVDEDNLRYYNCRCSEHNQNCVLSNIEISNNPHIYCNNVHNLFVDISKVNDLKINREASYNEQVNKKNSRDT